MEVPWSNPSLECTQAHHTHGRIIIGYNMAITILEGIEVQLFNYEMKVIMEPVEILTADGVQSGKFEVPCPPYACTTIHKELQPIHFNEDQMFHREIMISKGRETGMSGIVIMYDLINSEPRCNT
jgi:hypothetical protein